MSTCYALEVRGMDDEWEPLDDEEFSTVRAAQFRQADFGCELRIVEVVGGVREPIE